MKKNKKSNYILILLICLMTLYLINSNLITKHILIYTKLFIEKLFPASFLYFTFSTLLIEYNIIPKLSKLLKTNGANFYIITMSMISGFPSGSKYTKELLEKGLISKTNANYLIRFTHFPNPIFILGPVQTLFNNKKTIYFIFFSIILSNFLIAILTKEKEKEKIEIKTKNPNSFSKILPTAIICAFKTLLIIYGISIFFYLIITLINHYITFSLYNYVLLNGIFDLTNGIFLTSLIKNTIIRSLLIIFFISFGSLSVHMQTKSIIADTKIKYKNFFIGRMIGTTLSICIFLLLSYITNL